MKPIEEKADTKPDTFKHPGALAERKTPQATAADYAPKTATGIPGMTNGQSKLSAMPGLQASAPTKPAYKQEEVIGKRTSHSTTFRNKDGSYTTKRYYAPKFYKKAGNWQKD